MINFEQTELVYSLLGPMASVGAGEAAMSRIGEAAMSRILEDLLLFSCLAAFVTGVVIAAAALFI